MKKSYEIYPFYNPPPPNKILNTPLPPPPALPEKVYFPHIPLALSRPVKYFRFHTGDHRGSLS